MDASHDRDDALDLDLDRAADGDPEARRKQLIEHVEVMCEAVLGRGRVTIGHLEGLTAGDTVPLDCSPSDPVELRVNGKPIARGEIVTMDDRFGIRITEIG